MPQRRMALGHPAIVAADIVQNSSVCRFDQIREDRRVNILAVTAIARGYDFFVVMGTGQKRPEFECVGHEIFTLGDYLIILMRIDRKHHLARDAL